MSYVLKFTTNVRALARTFGITRQLSMVAKIVMSLVGKGNYEAAFDLALRDALKPGDIVWDVGANVGFYTRVFSESVGSAGVVCAFEPVPSCFEELRKQCGDRENVKLFNVALGDRTATLPMQISEDPLGSTHTLSASEGLANSRTTFVPVLSGDDAISRKEVPSPTFLKVDVEGFEEEVLNGLRKALASPKCRAVFCEVHFGILERRGERHAPSRIQQFLRDLGFKVRWTGASHLEALK